MIGDRMSDILAGQAAGCRTILVRSGAAGAGADDFAPRPDFVAADLVEAARFIDDITGTAIRASAATESRSGTDPLRSGGA
jgi:ribonucleotide monophosphatase NagD (HAD superfamily)